MPQSETPQLKSFILSVVNNFSARCLRPQFGVTRYQRRSVTEHTPHAYTCRTPGTELHVVQGFKVRHLQHHLTHALHTHTHTHTPYLWSIGGRA